MTDFTDCPNRTCQCLDPLLPGQSINLHLDMSLATETPQQLVSGVLSLEPMSVALAVLDEHLPWLLDVPDPLTMLEEIIGGRPGAEAVSSSRTS
jgi:hypothetical protein